MPDDNRTQGPSNDAPRDPLDDLIYPILNRDVPAESIRAAARPSASNRTRRDPLDDLLTDADLRTEILPTPTLGVWSKDRAKRTRGKRLYDRAIVIVAVCMFGTVAAIIRETLFGPPNRLDVWSQPNSAPPSREIIFQEPSANPKRESLPNQIVPIAKPVPEIPVEPPEPPTPKLTPEELYEKVSPSVVRVNVRNAQSELISHGSGFFVRDDSTVVTNFHVIEGGDSAEVVLSDGALLPVRGVEAFSMQSDVAVLWVTRERNREIRPLSLSGDELPRPASKAYVIGAPVGLDNSASDGLVSGHREIDERTWIQTTAPISPGSSGSPVFNEHGLVIGMATKSHVGGQNLNFALATRHLREILPVGVRSLPMKLTVLPSRKLPQRQAAAPSKPADPVNPRDDEDGLKEAQKQIASGVNRRALQVLDDIPESRRGPNYWRVRASALFAVANYQDSAKSYSESLKLDNTHSDTWIRYATALRLHWVINRDAILVACRAALTIDPKDARAYHLMGVTLPSREERIDALKTALSLDENDASTHYQLGCEFAERQKGEARKHFKRALDLVVKKHASYQAIKPLDRGPSAGVTLREIEWDNRIEDFTQKGSLETFLKLNLAAICDEEERILICRDVLKSEPQNELAEYMIEHAMLFLGRVRPHPDVQRLPLAVRSPPEFRGEIALSSGKTGILVFRK